MSADLRGFAYAAEPLLVRRRWELDALVAQLGRQVARIGEQRAACDELRAQLASNVQASARSRDATIDPGAQARSLQWLAGVQGRIAGAQAALAALEARREVLRGQMREMQAGIEALEADRKEALQEHAQAEGRRAAAEADRDWIARASWTQAGGTDSQEIQT